MKQVIAVFIVMLVIFSLGVAWGFALSWSISSLFKVEFTFLQGLGATGLIICLKLLQLFWSGNFKQ